MKPILFHDIDGVLFGEYDGHFQLRPGMKSWLTWAHERFDVVWLTSWEKTKIEQLLQASYCEGFFPLVYADWSRCADKTVWLKTALPRLQGRQAFWIDDLEAPVDGLEAVHVNPEGRDELERLRRFLEERLYNNGADVPLESVQSGSSSRF